MVNVLFVCLGNICRSPAAEGVFRALVDAHGMSHAISADSAGTAGWHVGKPPDPRSVATARRRGVDLKTLRARQVSAGDFHRFDYILAMDDDNLAHLEALQPVDGRAQLGLFLAFAKDTDVSGVPDPYYGGDEAFEHMFDLIETGAHGLLTRLRSEAG